MFSKGFSFFTFVLVWQLLVLQSCIPPKAIFLGQPDQNDVKRFKNNTIAKSGVPFKFHETQKQWGNLVKVNDWTSDLPVFASLETIVKEHSTQAFLLIHNDTILYEYYREGSNADELHSSYSIAKSVTSALTGIAIKEGYIKSINDMVTAYIPELNFKPEFEKLTLKHLLNHTSGIKYSLSSDAGIYYGNDLWKTINRIEFETLPGTKQSYININTQLLGVVLKRATGVSLSNYLQEKIWKPLGMESDATWSTDNKKLEKNFCCLNAVARDYAKFGRLYLNNGNWEGKEIIPSQWIEASLANDTTEGSSFAYNFSWHLGLKNYNDFMAIGLYKQHIYVNRDKNMIIVLLNHRENKLKAERVNWWYIFRQIADQLN